MMLYLCDNQGMDFQGWQSARVMMILMVLVAPALAADVDTSSPKAAMKSLYAAVERGDEPVIRQILFVENDPQQALVKAYANLILSSKRLGDVTRKKYPGAPNLMAQGTILPEDAARIDAAAVAIDGNNATVKITGRPETVSLRRIDGAWRVLLSEGTDTDPAHRADRIQMLQSLADAITLSADEINADKFPTVQEAENVVKQRLGVVLAKALQNNPPASRPTTRP